LIVHHWRMRKRGIWVLRRSFTDRKIENIRNTKDNILINFIRRGDRILRTSVFSSKWSHCQQKVRNQGTKKKEENEREKKREKEKRKRKEKKKRKEKEKEKKINKD
jgi:hypothetical protein